MIHLGTRSQDVFRQEAVSQFSGLYGSSKLDVVGTLISESEIVETALTRSLGALGLFNDLIADTHKMYEPDRRVVHLSLSSQGADYDHFDVLPIVDSQEVVVRGMISPAFFRRFYSMIQSCDTKQILEADDTLELTLRAGYRFMHARAYLGTAFNLVYPQYRQSEKLAIANHILDAGRSYLIPDDRWRALDETAQDYYRFVTLPYRVASRYIIEQLAGQISEKSPGREVPELYTSMLENRMMAYGYAKDSGLTLAPIDIGLANPLSDTEVKAVLQGLHLLHRGLY